MASKVFLDLAVPRNRLTYAGLQIPIPIMLPPVPNQHASLLLDLTKKNNAFHAMGNSAT
jgi:hypothetical protein